LAPILISFSGRLVTDHGSTVFDVAGGCMKLPRCGPGGGAESDRGLCDCVIGVRAEQYECGAPEALTLELYPMERARGMAIEAPVMRP
jgi:hypothetical protein